MHITINTYNLFNKNNYQNQTTTLFKVPYQNVKKELLWCDSVYLSGCHSWIYQELLMTLGIVIDNVYFRTNPFVFWYSYVHRSIYFWVRDLAAWAGDNDFIPVLSLMTPVLPVGSSHLCAGRAAAADGVQSLGMNNLRTPKKKTNELIKKVAIGVMKK